MRRTACSLLIAAAALHGAAAQPSGGMVEAFDFVPSSEKMAELMLDLAEVTAKDRFVDLGSGDGRLVIAAAKRGARAHGIDLDPELVAQSRRNAEQAGVGARATFERADIFKSDFSDADVVSLYLLPHLMDALRPTLLAMKPGTRVVSNSFELGAWFPDRVASVREECDLYFCKALLWIVPAKVGGAWTIEGGGAGELSLTQTFQTLTGTLARGGERIAVTGRLTGNAIRFTAGSAEYSGTITGPTIEGTTQSGERWRARRGA